MHREHEKATDPSSKPSNCQDMSTFMKSYKSHKPFFIFYKSSGLLWHTQVPRSFSEGICVREVRMYMDPEPVFQHPVCMPLHCPICTRGNIQSSRSEDILRNLRVFPTSAAVQQILHLIWQTMLSHLGDKYGKDILSF